MYFESIIKQCYRIKINCLVSVGAEKLNRNINLRNSSITKVVPIKIYSFLRYSKFGPLRNFLFSTFSIGKRLPFHFLLFLIDLKASECDELGKTDLRILVMYTAVQK